MLGIIVRKGAPILVVVRGLVGLRTVLFVTLMMCKIQFNRNSNYWQCVLNRFKRYSHSKG